ncbi:MAG: hypothetical protein MPW14_24500 [Candidatus Manganitrophus sp.]|nr:MAG: hypothetical protein MPW14_24500 [Candidatus Manganitrophus sp.]
MRNENDLEDVPEEVKRSLTFILLGSAEEVLKKRAHPCSNGKSGLLV